MACPKPTKVPSLEESIAFAAEKHAGQLDKQHQPYILHPIRVMLMMLTFVERTIAILHDLVEDTDVTLEELRERGYSNIIVTAVDAVSKREGESYEDFIRRAARHPTGRKIKKADILDNMSPMRRYSLDPEHSTRLGDKYTIALEIIRQAEVES